MSIKGGGWTAEDGLQALITSAEAEDGGRELICVRRHPYGARYRLQGSLCPWCDWQMLSPELSGRPDPLLERAEWLLLKAKERSEDKGSEGK